ncbi:hypothetical protein N7517_008633 [Penicillium concentricum]|uniref:Uncharacterized protein n=1 Tax=Penicillium concentricum TaxID=293559 RepID=A0A9W9RT30_9EURO|nr:uncharacterized protein N7517_008633 [Penicillium concentricum]KAJ5365747.1 hypothetical protein N7517_008633 [Penicillium concentricum]
MLVIQQQTNLFAAQSALDLLALAIPKCSNLFLGGINSRMHLVEWVLLALLEFLPAEIHTLVPAQTGVFLLNLWQASLLECGICGLESALGVPVDLGCVLRGQRQGI